MMNEKIVEGFRLRVPGDALIAIVDKSISRLQKELGETEERLSRQKEAEKFVEQFGSVVSPYRYDPSIVSPDMLRSMAHQIDGLQDVKRFIDTETVYMLTPQEITSLGADPFGFGHVMGGLRRPLI